MTTSAISKNKNGKPEPDNKKAEHDFLAVGIGESAGGKRAGELLRGTEKHFRTLFELGPVAIFSCDLAGVVQDYNRRAAEIWGREPKRGDPCEKYCGSFNLYHPDGRLLPHDESPIVEVLRAGVAVGGVEVFIERPDGTRVPVIVNFAPLIDEHGAVTGAITSFLDITERKHAEETLRVSEELNTAIISSLSAQIAVLDGDGNITAVNQAWQEFARENNGKVDRTGIGINYLQICRNSAGKFAENASEAMTGIKAVLKGKLPVFSLEYPCHSPNERRWFLLNATPLRNESGGAVISHQNITERKRAEDELRESEEFKRGIIESSPDCIKVLDLEGNLISMEAGQELLCIDDITPFLNKSWTEFWEGADREAAQAAVDAAAAGGNGNFVGFFRNMRGEPKWWNVAISPILDADGNPVRLLAVSRDVTEHQTAEEVLRKHEWRLRYATESAQLTFVEIDLVGGGAMTPENFAAVMGFPLPDGHEHDPSVGGRVLLEHVVAEDRPRVEAALREFFDGKSVGKIDYRVLGDDQIERWIETRWSMELSPNGKPLKSFATNLDITERKQAEAALRSSEERYRNLFDSMDEGYCTIEMIFDEHGKPVDYRYLEINPSFEKLTGMHDALGKRISEFVPDLEESWLEIYGKVALTGEPIRVADEVKGMNRWFDIYAFRIGGNESREVAILFRNITESKQTERQTEMLSNLSRRLASATEEAEIVEIAVGAVGRHLNGHRCYFVECLADENRLLVSHNWVRDEAPSIEGELSLFDFGGIEWWREFASGDFIMEDVATNPLTRANSSSYYAVGVPSYAVQPFRRDADWTVCLVVTEKSPRKWTAYDLRVLADVVARVWPLVERARADLELRESEAQLSLALDAAELGSWHLDPSSNLFSADERFRVIFGVTAEKLSHEHAFTLVHPEDQERVHDAMAAATRLDNPVAYEVEYRVVHPDGSLHWVFVKGRAIFGNEPAGRRLLSFDGTIADITERKQLEANLAFLADIGQDLARITTVDETMRTVGAKMGAYLDLSLCTFIEIDDAEDHATVNYEWHRDDVPSGIGVHRISDFMTGEFQAAGRAGETFIIRNTATDERATAERFAAFKIASMVTVPIIKDGEWQFLMCIYRSDAHDWREDEIALTQELSVRIFTRLESSRALTALHKSEQLIRSIYDGAQEYIGLITPDGTVLEANRASLEFGPSKIDDVFGLPFWEAVWFKHTDGAPQMVREAIAIAAGGEFFRQEMSLSRPSGETITFDFSLHPIRDEQGKVIFIVPEGRDITARKQAEEALRESENNFRTLADSMSQLAWMTDVDGSIFWYNQRWFEYTGTTLEEMRDSGWQAIHHPSSLARSTKKFKRHIATGKDWEDTFLLRAKTGEYRWFLSRAVPIRDREGKILRWFGTNTDIDDVRRAEEILALSRDELELRVQTRTGELRDANAALKAQVAERHRAQEERITLLKKVLTAQEDERRRIARDMHDHFGQQLTALRLHLESLGQISDDTVVIRKVSETKKIAKQLDSDVSFLVWELRPSALDDLGLKDALAHYVEKWTAQFGISAGFHVRNLDGEHFSGEAETCLYRIAQESLNNVYKHAGATQASVLLEKRNDGIVMIVEDNGTGFAPDKTLKRRKGLGLIGMRERAALAGGTVEIESAPGKGTTIFVRIPLGAETTKHTK